MKIIYSVILLFIVITEISSQDTASYSMNDIISIYNDIKARNEQPDIKDKIKYLELLENNIRLIRNDSVYKSSDGKMKPEFYVIEKPYLDSMLNIFNYTKDSLKSFRDDIYNAEKLVNKLHGDYNKQLYFLLYEKIIPSFLIYFKEFRDIYAAILKKTGNGECCNGK